MDIFEWKQTVNPHQQQQKPTTFSICFFGSRGEYRVVRSFLNYLKSNYLINFFFTWINLKINTKKIIITNLTCNLAAD